MPGGVEIRQPSWSILDAVLLRKFGMEADGA